MDEHQQTIFKDAMEKALFKADAEKTRFDKLMGRDEMQRLKQVFSKPSLSIEDVNEVQNLIVSSEIKLTDFRGRERYINHKFYIVIGMFASRYCKAIRADQEYDSEMKKIKEDLEKKSLEEKNKRLNNLENVIKIRAEIQKDYAIMYKEMVNAYLFGVRSPLSFEGNMVNMLGTDKKEYTYSGNLSPIPQQSQENKGVVN
jgi:hypothetical protein